jgi:ferredoxin
MLKVKHITLVNLDIYKNIFLYQSMNVDMLDDSRKRKNGTECILCTRCINDCPKNALRLTK